MTQGLFILKEKKRERQQSESGNTFRLRAVAFAEQREKKKKGADVHVVDGTCGCMQRMLTRCIKRLGAMATAFHAVCSFTQSQDDPSS